MSLKDTLKAHVSFIVNSSNMTDGNHAVANIATPTEIIYGQRLDLETVLLRYFIVKQK